MEFYQGLISLRNDYPQIFHGCFKKFPAWQIYFSMDFCYTEGTQAKYLSEV